MNRDRVQYDDEMEIDLSRAARSVWRERWLLGVLFLLAIGVGVATTFYTRDTVYESQTTLFVQPGDGDNVAPTSLDFYEAIMRSEWVTDRVARRLGMVSGITLDSALTVEPTREPHLIRIKVRADSPERAVDLLTVWSDVFVERLRMFQEQRVDTANAVLSREIAGALQSIQDVRNAFAALQAEIGDGDGSPAGAQGVTEAVRFAVAEANESIETLQGRLAHLDDVLRRQRTTVYPLGEDILDGEI